jgi:glycine dehydrogenase
VAGIDLLTQNLLAASGFAERHIGTDAAAQSTMLGALGYQSVDELVLAAVPASIHVDGFRAAADSVLPPAATEREALAELRVLARKNTVNRSMIGLGYYDTITPAVIKRNVLENPSWYTAYTPYQPEISQGRLEALINFQTMVTDLTGLTTANASMLDEGTAVVEGMMLARRASKLESNTFIVDSDSLPQTLALLENRAAAVGIDLVMLDLAEFSRDSIELPEAFGIFVQYPGRSGRVWNPSSVIAAAKATGGLAVVAADLLALTLIASPGDLSASAFRWASAGRTRATWPCGPDSNASCPDASSESRRMPPVIRPTASRSRCASSTSVATRRPPTSAPPRCCSPSWPRCTRCITARRGCGRSPPG